MPSPKEHVDQLIRVPIYTVLFLKIAEPRVIRILQFCVYLACFWAGALVVMHKPEQFLSVLGPDLVFTFGLFILVGAFTGAIAVLPGIWWLERVGVILLFTCVCVYLVILLFLNATPVAVGFITGFGVCLAQRWIEIRGAQLAPRED